MNTREQAGKIIREWYRLWTGEERTPVARELRHCSEELILKVGFEKVQQALPILIKIMGEKWPDAKRWGATETYWPDALKVVAMRERERERQDRQQERMREMRAARVYRGPVPKLAEALAKSLPSVE